MKQLVDHQGRSRLYLGDCRDAVASIPSNSIDSIVTDPPYALVSVSKRFGKEGSKPAKHGTDGLYARASAGFMGKTWDTGEVAFAEAFWAECLRVLKPGGHVVSFGGTRTYHRLACAIEDAGFEIRDQLAWIYGTGFPKSHNQGDGIGTALKPAWEPIVLARKPLDGKSVRENLEKWGVGGLWIERCRVPTEDRLAGGAYAKESTREGLAGDPRSKAGMFTAGRTTGRDFEQPLGRWPANILHDGSAEVLEAFPVTGPGGSLTHRISPKTTSVYGEFAGEEGDSWESYGDSGSAARFFYTTKASRRDREEGCEHLPEHAAIHGSDNTEGGLKVSNAKHPKRNNHPTVKPTDLMQWAARLVTPPGGVVLDPFMGSGSTGKACLLEGFRFLGAELDPQYLEIAQARIAFAAKKREEDEWARFLGVA